MSRSCLVVIEGDEVDVGLMATLGFFERRRVRYFCFPLACRGVCACIVGQLFQRFLRGCLFGSLLLLDMQEDSQSLGEMQDGVILIVVADLLCGTLPTINSRSPFVHVSENQSMLIINIKCGLGAHEDCKIELPNNGHSR